VQSNATAFTEAFGQGATQDDIFGITAGFNYQHQLDVDNAAIPSWEKAFGPAQFNGDNFTTLVRYNFTDGISTSYQGFDIIGFGQNANETSTPQPFKAQDMVMVGCLAYLIQCIYTDPTSSTTACARRRAPSRPNSSRTKATSAPSLSAAARRKVRCRA
jgi:hypothetical protein